MRSGKLTIATCQHAVCGDISANLAAITKLAGKARSQGAEIAHFSESNLTGYPGLDYKKIDPAHQPAMEEALAKLMELAGSMKIWLIIGGHQFTKEQEKPFNSLFLINDRGEMHDRYDKRWLAGTGTELEHLHFSPGRKPVVFTINGVKCGMLICHEWRYPELYREHKGLKVDLLFHSWYDGNLSTERYHAAGRELGELISGTVRGYAANNYLWISGSNTCRKESCFPGFMVQPDGRIRGKLARNRPGVLISEIDLADSFVDPSGHARHKFIPST